MRVWPVCDIRGLWTRKIGLWYETEAACFFYVLVMFVIEGFPEEGRFLESDLRGYPEAEQLPFPDMTSRRFYFNVLRVWI